METLRNSKRNQDLSAMADDAELSRFLATVGDYIIKVMRYFRRFNRGTSLPQVIKDHNFLGLEHRGETLFVPVRSVIVATTSWSYATNHRNLTSLKAILDHNLTKLQQGAEIHCCLEG